MRWPLLAAILAVTLAAGCSDSPTAPTVVPAPIPGPAPGTNPGPAANRPPQITRITCDPCTVPPRGTSHLVAVAVDPDGDPLTYIWEEVETGTMLPETSPELAWTAPAEPGERRLAVTVTDGRGGSHRREVALMVPAPALGSTPPGVNPNDWLAMVGPTRTSPGGLVVANPIGLSSAATDAVRRAEAEAAGLNPGLAGGPTVVVTVRLAREDELTSDRLVDCPVGGPGIGCQYRDEIIFASEGAILTVRHEGIVHEFLHKYGFHHGGDGVMLPRSTPISAQDRLICEAASYLPSGTPIVR
jgi:hypothetical protein